MAAGGERCTNAVLRNRVCRRTRAVRRPRSSGTGHARAVTPRWRVDSAMRSSSRSSSSSSSKRQQQQQQQRRWRRRRRQRQAAASSSDGRRRQRRQRRQQPARDGVHRPFLHACSRRRPLRAHLPARPLCFSLSVSLCLSLSVGLWLSQTLRVRACVSLLLRLVPVLRGLDSDGGALGRRGGHVRPLGSPRAAAGRGATAPGEAAARRAARRRGGRMFKS